MGDRKYRQQGYMDRDKKPEGRPASQPKSENTFAPRTLNMPGKVTVSRCSECGTILPAMAEPTGNCPKCATPLHTCKQCTYFDPSARFECQQSITERIVKKSAANTCQFFALKTTVERETSSGGTRTDDARRAFENLFKK